MRKIGGICLGMILLLTACVHDYKLKPINHYDLFHDNSSKVWLVNHLYKDNSDHAPLSFDYKEVIIFHKTKTCYVHKIKNFGNKPGRKADFYIDMNKKEISIDFDKSSWIFEISSYGQDKIILKPKYNSFKYTMELIPFPEY